MDLKSIIENEKIYINSFPVELDESKADNELTKWRSYGLGVDEENRTEESLDRSVIKSFLITKLCIYPIDLIKLKHLHSKNLV